MSTPMSVCVNCGHLFGEHYVSEPGRRDATDPTARRCHHADPIPADFAAHVMCGCRNPIRSAAPVEPVTHDEIATLAVAAAAASSLPVEPT